MKNFYDQLRTSYQEYFENYGCPPNLICINSGKYADFYNWSSKNECVIEMLPKPKIFGVEITHSPSFDFDFKYFEIEDIREAIKNGSSSVYKSVPKAYDRKEDEIVEYVDAEFTQLEIPEVVITHLKQA